MRESRLIELELPGGAPLLVHAEQFGEPSAGGAPSDIALAKLPSFDKVAAAIKGVATAVHGAVDSLQPEVVEVELGLDLAVKGGLVMAMLVDADSSASLKIKLVWHPGKDKQQDGSSPSEEG